jgi:hypothetical protein
MSKAASEWGQANADCGRARFHIFAGASYKLPPSRSADIPVRSNVFLKITQCSLTILIRPPFGWQPPMERLESSENWVKVPRQAGPQTLEPPGQFANVLERQQFASCAGALARPVHKSSPEHGFQKVNPNETKNDKLTSLMKTFRMLMMAGATAVSLISPRALMADGTTPPPTVVPQDRDDRDLLRDLQGVPDNIKTLILNFDAQRDQYLMQQKLLLIKLRHATTPAEREAIRDQLQANRKEFLTDLKDFRQDLKADLKADRANITLGELRRILDAAKDAAREGSHRHRNQ